MTAQEIRKKYLDFFVAQNHSVIPRASLVPQNDPTTLFTGSGMQPLIPYLLGESHPEGTRLVNSQTCFRAEDMDEAGDIRHTTFFEMLGNWSLGDYFKKEQLSWFFEFLTDEVGLDPKKLYVTCFIGDKTAGVPKDTEAADIWKELFKSKGIDAAESDIGSEEDGYSKGIKPGERIFFYDAKKNWWSRAGVPSNMPDGEPGGPDSEVFYEFDQIEHSKEFGEHCHPNCDCGRFLEIGNSVFMAYKKTAKGFEPLPKPNIDFGGGLERIAAAQLDDPDMFKISLLWPIVEELEKLSGKKYEGNEVAMRVIADHLRAASFLAVDGVMPSNKEQGYVVRRLLRRAIRFAFDLDIKEDFCEKIANITLDLYAPDFPEVKAQKDNVIAAFKQEEKLFRETLKRGLREFNKLIHGSKSGSPSELTGEMMFKLYDTYGFPTELILEEVKSKEIKLSDNWQKDFDKHMEDQRKLSQTATKGVFKGGLADHSEETTKLHTSHHLLLRALKDILGDHVVQRGSNITAERLRIDFANPEKVTREQLDEAERIVNEKIAEDLPVIRSVIPREEAEKLNAEHEFGAKYPDMVSVYSIGPKDATKEDPKHEQAYSIEFCGGPHVTNTGKIAENGKKFKITKEEASSAGVRRIKAVLI
jgi:alanyl-tRNA synthetase